MKRVISICFIILFFGCVGEDKPNKPSNLISKNDMESILYDLYIINGAKGVNGKVLEQNGLKPETYVLEKHKIDSLQFAVSNDYYSYDAELYKSMIDNVKAKLEKKKEEFEDLEKEKAIETKRKRDSIKEVTKLKKDSLREIIERHKDSSKVPSQKITVDN